MIDFVSIFTKLFPKRGAATNSHAVKRVRPTVESLADRIAPALLT